MRFLIAIAAVLMSLATASVHAETVTGLYQVREALVSQESDVRDAGLQQAFFTLMQRLTGQTDAAKSSQLAKFQADPQPLISRYGYEGNTLVVNFDPASVQSALRKAGLPIWGSNRPVVLAWWHIDDLDGSRLVSDGQPNAPKLYAAAQHYGIPARLPLGDLTEQLMLDDALGNNEAIRNSAERYTADAVVIVEQQLDGDSLVAHWQLWVGDERQQGQVSASSQALLARDVFAQVSQHLAARFAIKPGQGELLSLRIDGVNLERFVLVERLLEPFDAKLLGMNKNYAQWQVRSTPEQLRAQLALAHLHEQTAPVTEAGGSAAEYPDSTATDNVFNEANSGAQLLYFSW